MIDRLIENAAQMDRVIRFICRQRFPFRVTVTDGRPRSYDQNKLQWMWATEAGEQRGMSGVEVMAEWRLLFGAPILLAENSIFPLFWKPVAAKLTHEEQVLAMMGMNVTSLMSVSQHKRFLDDVQRYCIENGIELTDPEESRHGPKIGSRVDRGTGSGDPFDRQAQDRKAPGRQMPGLHEIIQREAPGTVRPSTSTNKRRGE